MKKIITILFIVLIAISLVGCVNEDKPDEKYTLLELQADYDQLVEFISLNPQIFTNEEELNGLIVSQRELLINNMTKLEFYRTIIKVVAAIRCGHTGIYMSASENESFFNNKNTYPVSVSLFNNHLRVVAINGFTSLEIGDEITSINKESVQDIIQDMMSMLSADGDGTSFKNQVLADNFFEYYRLFIANDDRLNVEYYSNSSEKTKTETLRLNSRNKNLYVQEPPYEYQLMPNYAILTLRQFSPYGTYTLQSYYDFFSTFFQMVDQEEVENIILDIRGNGGGDPRITSDLFSYLAKTSQPYFNQDAPNYYTGLKENIPLQEPHFDGQLYTLIDGYCFSTCGHFAALIKYQNVGMMIGTETNGSYICSDSSISLTLTNSQLTFRTSRAAWSVDVEGLEYGRGVFPDLEVLISFEDYMAGNDRTLLTAINLINNT